MRINKTFGFALSAIASALVVAGCGGGDSGTAAPTPQTISFTAPTTATVGGTGNLAATASSGLAVAYTSATTSVCTVAGSVVTYAAAGTCTIKADQAGNGTFSAATQVSRDFTVSVPVLTFSSGFTAQATGTGATLNGGNFGGYAGSDLDGWYCAPGGPCGGASFSPTAATSSVYYYYSPVSVPTAGSYVGLFVQAPTVTAISATADTAGVQLNGQSSVAFTFNQNPEWFALSNHNVLLMLTLGKRYLVNGNACNIKLQTVFTPTAVAATSYTVPLSKFTVAQNCGVAALTPSSVTAALASTAGGPVSQIDFQGDAGASAITAGNPPLTTSANWTTRDQYGGFATTLSLTGPITFQ